MNRFHNLHQGQRALILGNGPSLKGVDLQALRANGKVFGTNRIYVSGFTPDYYVACNPLVLSQFGEEIAELDCVKFLSATNGATVPKGNGETIPLDTSYRLPSFRSPMGSIWEGHTVTYIALQLAYFMGFEEVVLLGVDHDYGRNYQPNLELVATGEDVGHFDPTYFTGGVRWHAPDLASSEIAYSLARKTFEDSHRRVINASAHTKLNVFPIVPLNHVLCPKRVSAIVSAYKAKNFLVECLADLMEQTETPEIVVVCQDGSPEHLIASAIDTENILIVTTPDIPSVYAAWNLGAERAYGRYLTNANTDDRHHPESMRIMADILDGRPDIDLVYHDQYVTWKPNQTFEEFAKENEGKELLSGRTQGKPGFFAWADYQKKSLFKGCFIGPQPMWRANLHQRFGYFEEQYQSAGDYEFWLRCAGDHNYLHVPLPLGLYLARPDGIELGNPALSADEATSAIYLHQTTDMEIAPLSDKFYRVDLGDEFIVVTGDTIKSWAAWVTQKEAEYAAVRVPVSE